MSNEKILRKIKKLFALGSNNPNSNEAENAIRMAKKLLDKHNFSVYDLKDENQVGVKIEDNVNMPWVRVIYGSISRLFDSNYIIDKSCKPNQHLIVGTESNRVTASIIIEYVLKEIRSQLVGKGNGARNAAAVGVREQVDSILAERNRDMGEVIPGTGLTPMNVSMATIEENNAWAAKFIGGIRNTNSYFSSNGKYKKVGSNINLNVQLSNKKALN